MFMPMGFPLRGLRLGGSGRPRSAASMVVSLILAVGLFGTAAYRHVHRAGLASALEKLPIAQAGEDALSLDSLRITATALKQNLFSFQVTGLLNNNGGEECITPAILMEALDADGRAIATQGSAITLVEKLPPGASIRFETATLKLTSSQLAAVRSFRIKASGGGMARLR